MLDRMMIGKVYYRIFKDSGFRMDYIDVARLTAKLLGYHPLEIADSIGLSNMERVAKNEFVPKFPEEK